MREHGPMWRVIEGTKSVPAKKRSILPKAVYRPFGIRGWGASVMGINRELTVGGSKCGDTVFGIVQKQTYTHTHNLFSLYELIFPAYPHLKRHQHIGEISHQPPPPAPGLALQAAASP